MKMICTCKEPSPLVADGKVYCVVCQRPIVEYPVIVDRALLLQLARFVIRYASRTEENVEAAWELEAQCERILRGHGE
jgi:hypothetical protein